VHRCLWSYRTPCTCLFRCNCLLYLHTPYATGASGSLQTLQHALNMPLQHTATRAATTIVRLTMHHTLQQHSATHTAAFTATAIETHPVNFDPLRTTHCNNALPHTLQHSLQPPGETHPVDIGHGRCLPPKDHFCQTTAYCIWSVIAPISKLNR